MQVACCPVLEWNTDTAGSYANPLLFFHSLLSSFVSLADNYIYKNVHKLILFILLCDLQDVKLRTAAFGSLDIGTHE